MSGPDVASPRLVSTRIAAVTVYRNGALVVRRGSGRGLIEVRGLPLLFASDSLRVRPARGTARELEETARLQSVPAPVPAAEDDLERVRLELTALEDELGRCVALQKLLEETIPRLPDVTTPASIRLVDAGAVIGLVEFSGARARALLEQTRALERRRKNLVEELQRLKQRAQAVPPEAPRILRGVRFRLDDVGGEDAPFELEYFVSAARWVPAWALHLEGAHAQLEGAALVAQASGEDWTDVELAVCTADLSRDTTLPSLSSWRIGRAQAERPRGFRPLATDLPTLFAGFDKGPRRDAAVPASTTTSPPSSAAPARSAVSPRSERHDAVDRDRTDEVRAARAQEPLALSASAADEQHAEGAEEDGPPTRAAPSPAIAALPPMAAPPPPAARMAPARFANPPMPGAMGDRSVRARAAVPPSAELPARWRTAYMRMAGPSEPRRGALLPLDSITLLEWLLAAHDVQGDEQANAAARAEVTRAVRALTQGYDRLQSEPLPRGTQLVEGTHFASLMRAGATTDVPGDGTYHRVVVREEHAPATYEHRAVPRESNDVWRSCRLEVNGPPLPAGPLTVYENGAFRVNARLDGSGGGRMLQVNLGIDPDVRVASRTVHSSQAEKGLMSQTSRVEHHVKIEVRSTAKEPAQLIVHDRLPVPADNVRDVTVAVLEERPPLQRTQKDARGDEVPGAFEWRGTVMPGDTQTFELKYAIELPARSEIEGGNRRE